VVNLRPLCGYNINITIKEVDEMAAITLATLKKGAESLGIEVEPKISKKDLDALITEKLATQELGYECPSCGKDIPDLDSCPYCGENFIEEDNNEVSDNEPEITNENIIPEDTIKETDNKGEAEGPSDKVGETKKPDKAKTGTKSKAKDAPKTGKDSEEYKNLIATITETYPELIAKINASGITYLVGKKRLMKVTGTAKSISIEFNESLQTDDDNVRKYTEDEAKAKHLGTVRAIYSFGDLDTALSLVKQAYQLRTAKETAEVK
jgi:hypothetical protein